ncbi:MAG: ABC-F family ATP-binding cassette domain-containing protein, partial [Candidatus Aminicenantes bacterium]|nr:ABC-F family ATP-binding cassette domain-containing protein [Candidatus Aminicenantes bacterium]
ILDEPTNHLDVKTKDIFQNALLHYSGTIILVSHDRYFLDHLVRRVFEIRNGSLHEYIGNYSYFIEKRDAERAVAAQYELAETGSTEVAGSELGASPPGSKKTDKSRELRRLEAEQRNQRGMIKKDIARKLHKLEGEIVELETIKTRNQEQLCDPELLRESARIKPLMQELNRAKRRLEELLPYWEELMHRLDELENK